MIESLLNTASQPSTLLLLVALIAMLESLAFVGILVPGVALLLGLASVAGQQSINLALLLLSGFIGAAAGDILSFFAGRYAAPSIIRLSLIKRHPQWIPNSRQYFHRYGVISVVLGRFIGPIRPVMPFVAGMSNMSPALFIAVNLLSALLWAPVYLLPGFFLGYGSNLLPPYWLDLTLFLLPFLAGLLLFPPLHKALQPGGAMAGLSRRIPVGQDRLGAWFMLIASLLLFLACAFLQFNPLLHQWQQTTPSLAQLMPVWLIDTLSGLTGLADPAFIMGAALITSLYLVPRSPGNAIWFLLALLLLFAADQTLNAVFTLAAPRLSVAEAHNFPDTDIALVGGLCTMLAVVLTAGLPAKHRRWIYLCSLCIALAVALGQILLSQHPPINSLGGLSLGLSAAACYRLTFQEKIPDAPGWKALLLVCVSIYGLLYMILNG